MKLTESQLEELIMLIHLEFLSLGASPELIITARNQARLRRVVSARSSTWFEFIQMSAVFFTGGVSEYKLELAMRKLTRNYLESIK